MELRRIDGSNFAAERAASMRDMEARTAEVLLDMQDARQRDDWQRAIDILEESPELGVRPPTLFFELAATSMERMCNDPAAGLRLMALCRSHGYLPTPVTLRSLLKVFSRTASSEGVHACLREIERSDRPLSDSLLRALCLALYSIGSHDRAFQLIDLFRATGDSAAFLLEYLLHRHRFDLMQQAQLEAATAPPSSSAAASGTARSREYRFRAFYRTVLTYLLVSPAVTHRELLVLAAHLARHNCAVQLAEMAGHARVVEALHGSPATAQAVFCSVLGAWRERRRGAPLRLDTP